MGVVPTLYGSGVVNSGFKSIGTTLLAAAAAAVTFSGISATYKEFIVTAWLLPVSGAGVQAMIRLNNDSGANYDAQGMYLDGASIGNSAGTARTAVDMDEVIGLFGGPFIGQAAIYKNAAGLEAMVFSRASFIRSGSIVSGFSATRWANAAALISRVDVLASSGNLDIGSIVRLEGLVP